MKTKIKIIIAAILAVVISVGSISVYKYVTTPKEESIPLKTVLEDASDLTTQKMVISGVFKSTKGKIPFITKNKFLVQYKTTVKAGFDVSKAKIKETDDQVTITIPHCTIDEDSIKIKSDDIKIYDTSFAVFSVEHDALMEVIGEAEKKAKKQANSQEYGFLENADENAKKVVKGLYENIVDDRKVVVEFQK